MKKAVHKGSFATLNIITTLITDGNPYSLFGCGGLEIPCTAP